MTDKEICKRLDFIISYCTALKNEIEKKQEVAENDSDQMPVYDRTDEAIFGNKPWKKRR